MVEKILQHKHCGVCGKAVPVDDAFCSDLCKDKFEVLMKKKRTTMLIFYTAMVFVIIVFILQAFLG